MLIMFYRDKITVIKIIYLILVMTIILITKKPFWSYITDMGFAYIINCTI